MIFGVIIGIIIGIIITITIVGYIWCVVIPRSYDEALNPRAKK